MDLHFCGSISGYFGTSYRILKFHDHISFFFPTPVNKQYLTLTWGFNVFKTFFNVDLFWFSQLCGLSFILYLLHLRKMKFKLLMRLVGHLKMDSQGFLLLAFSLSDTLCLISKDFWGVFCPWTGSLVSPCVDDFAFTS